MLEAALRQVRGHLEAGHLVGGRLQCRVFVRCEKRPARERWFLPARGAFDASQGGPLGSAVSWRERQRRERREERGGEEVEPLVCPFWRAGCWRSGVFPSGYMGANR